MVSTLENQLKEKDTILESEKEQWEERLREQASGSQKAEQVIKDLTKRRETAKKEIATLQLRLEKQKAII